MQQHCTMGNTMRKRVLTTDVIDTIIRGTENNKNTKENTMTAKKINLQKDWEQILVKYGLKEDKNGTLRDNKGRFVKFATIAAELDKLTQPDELKPEMDYNDNPTGVNVKEGRDSDEDVMGDLPDWGSMDLETILSRCIYMKKEVRKDGRIIRVPLLQKTVCKDGEEHLMPIPVRKIGDGDEIGYNRWGKQEPEEMYLNQATRAATFLITWGQKDLVITIDEEINRLKTGLVTASTIHPFKDGEDIIQALTLTRRAMKRVYRSKVAKIEAAKHAMVKLLGRKGAKEIWTKIVMDVELLAARTNWPEDGFEVVSDLVNDVTKYFMQKINDNLKGSQYIEGFGAVNTGNGMTIEVYKQIAAGISTRSWMEITKSLTPNVEEPSALWGTATRYAGAMLALEMLKVLEDNNSVDRQTEAIVGEKTPMSEWFKKEDADWVWSNRSQDFDDMPRGWLGRLPWQDKVGAESNNE